MIGHHFRLLTDQKSVSFLHNLRTTIRIKNEKIARWRTELFWFSFDVVSRPGKENAVTGALSRVCGSIKGSENFLKLNKELRHLGITRMVHVIRSRNVPFSVEEVRRITNMCQTFSAIKLLFYKPKPGALVRATQPFERLDLDLKGSLPTKTRNK